jgi:hypothetical protein
MRKLSNRKGQALITVLAFMLLLLFLGMILFEHSTGLVKQTNALIAYSDAETADNVLPDATYLILNDLYTDSIDAALAKAKIAHQENWIIGTFPKKLPKELNKIPDLLTENLTNFLHDDLEADYDIICYFTDRDANPAELIVEATREGQHQSIMMTFSLYKPTITNPDNNGNGADTGTYLSGQDPLIVLEALEY